MALPRHQRVIIGLSLQILRSAAARSADTAVRDVEVRLALRCLMSHCPERWPLDLFWDAAGQDNEIGRSQGVGAALNGIIRQLQCAGRYDAGPPS